MTFGNLSEVHKVRTCSKLAHSTPGKKIRTMEGKDAVSQQMLNSNIMEESKIRSLRWQYNNMLKIYTLYRNQVYTQLNRGTVILLYTLLKYQDCFGNSTLYFKGKYSTKKINLDERFRIYCLNSIISLPFDTTLQCILQMIIIAIYFF